MLPSYELYSLISPDHATALRRLGDAAGRGVSTAASAMAPRPGGHLSRLPRQMRPAKPR